MKRTVLVVAAHADDEVIGCGGTLARHVANGDSVHAVFMADGVSSRPAHDEGEMTRRLAAASKAHEILSLKEVVFLGLPDNRMDSLPLLDLIQPLEAVIAKVSPQIVYTHHVGDLNIDHRLTHKAVLTACRPQPGTAVTEIMAFEIMSSTDWAAPAAIPFVPNHFVNIADYLDIKFKALEAYSGEMRPPPHSRSIEHLRILAKHRGFSVGMKAAEAFVVVRSLLR